jgi:PST family polysaccharide transporter
MLRRVGTTFLALLLVRGFAVLGPLIVMPVLVKRIGLEGWGMISYATAVTAFAGAAVQYGFSVSATAEIAKIRGSDDRLASMWSTYFTASCWLAAAALAVGLIGIFAFEAQADMQLLLVGALLMAIATSLVPIWLFMGVERMKGLVLSNLLNRAGYVVLVLVLVNGPAQTPWVTLIGAAAATAGLLAALVEVKRDLQLPLSVRAPVAKVAETLRNGFPVFTMLTLPLLYNAGGVFVLGLTAGKAEVGLFSVGFTIVESAIIGGRLLTNAVLPVVASESERHGFFARLTMGAGVAAALGMIVVSPFLARWLTPDHVAEASLVMALLALSIPFAFAQLVFGQNYLAIHGESGMASRIVTFASLAGVLLMAVLVPLAGAVGLAAVMLAARILLGGGSLIAWRRLPQVQTSRP